ncbi:putative NAM7-nonsense-mediated mRNA decay protein [Rosellinia necatrix]|uniref:Putative NAM7-nonsense-mediated mRNA decay protein n=1 Tax=Rosellinia necatrix TaxID=77044 RepID=A0A0E4B9U5_ROSNE|nr:RNA-dependent RNA polymerase [Rosellinia necatrix]GAP83628.1 putative NAM7-nonsense-mediated mRNA decay protein [Rosellinia necatrix]
MEKIKLGAYEQTLQSISLADREWKYGNLKLPGPRVLDGSGYVKSISLVSSDIRSHIVIRLQALSPNRATEGLKPSDLLLVSFSVFRPRYDVVDESGEYKPWARKESIGYITNLLRTGIEIQGARYNFYGYSNSQLKSRTCLLLAASKEAISKRIESFGDFSKMKTVAKKAKRIGLLFSTARAATTVEPSRCEDIPDVENDNYVFTDGCGMISPRFAQELSRLLRLIFRDKRYTPSVFQIRYRGYKGVVMVDPTIKDPRILLKLRKSMKKFSGGDDFSFSVVEYSKPYAYGYLNDEVVILINSLGIQEETLLKKQAEHFEFLREASRDPRVAFRFLCYVDKTDLAERLLMESLEAIRPEILKLVNAEKGKMLSKRDTQKCRILIQKSRLLYGICDPWGVLKEGECHVKVTTDENGLPQTLKNAHVLVTRNPCLHAGDLQKFKLVSHPELSHLVDCIVFPIRGERPSADMMSGGDLDGDKFFVCWDEEIMPSKLSDPALYPATREPLSFKPISDDDRLQFFSKYSSVSLGRIKNLYLDWVKVKGPMAPECQELNRLFSQCVDGNSIKVPPKLESPPKPSADTSPFILEVLHESAIKSIRSINASPTELDGYNFDAIQLLLNRDGIAISEFELVKLTFKWCRLNKTPLHDLLHFFDLNSLTAEEKAWTISQLPVLPKVPNLIMNALCSSGLVSNQELDGFALDHPRIRWKRVYDSSRDRMATFLEETTRALELFHRKLIILRVDERLTIALYVPKKVERSQDYLVDDHVRLLAFPHSQGPELQSRLCLPTKVNYRLCCDDNSFQLFEGQRRNTWIHIRHGGSDDSSYRNIANTGDRRRQRQGTLDSGRNFDFVVSVALDKFSRSLQKHIGRVNRNGVLAAEVYVITNRDVQSMQTLDLWLKYIDTEERMPLFDEEPKEYSIPSLHALDLTSEREYIARIASEELSVLNDLESADDILYIFKWLWERNAKDILLQSVTYLLDEIGDPESTALEPTAILDAIFTCLEYTPSVSVYFAQIETWNQLPEELAYKIKNRATNILRGLVLSANNAQELVLTPMKNILTQMEFISSDAFCELIELITLTVRLPDLALGILLECFEPECNRLLAGVDDLVVNNYKHNLMGIALDHIGEVDENAKEREDLLTLKLNPKRIEGNEVVETTFRIDSTGGTPERSAHVRLTVANRPTNRPFQKPYSMDALVVSSEKGMAKLRCLHPLPPHFEQYSWRLTYGAPFVTTAAMLAAVKEFAENPETSCSIWKQLLEAPSSLPISPPIAYQAQDKLNESQNAAVEATLNHPLVCLWGPPGTGKTQTIVAAIIALEQILRKERILVTAPTHNAVDNVMRRYLSMANPDKKLAIRVSTEVRKVAEDLRPYTLDAMAGMEIYSDRKTLKEAEKRVKSCRLVFTTCIGAGIGLLRNQNFEVVIIDEASQQTEPASLVPLTKGCQRALLVGDHVQLRPTVQQLASALDFDVSLFERLYTQTAGADSTDCDSGFPKLMLDTQYRMHPSICKFSSEQFYEGKLLTGIQRTDRLLGATMFPWPADANDKQDKARAIFIECAEREDKLAQRSKSNQGQALLCHRVCTLLSTKKETNAGQAKQDVSAGSEQGIAVLTPYTKQLEVLKKKLAGMKNIEVSSIDGYQGREADIVVFVTTRCNASCDIGFLKDLRRMNVALTRAKAGLIVIGNRGTLTQGTADPESAAMWKRLLGTLVVVDVG